MCRFTLHRQGHNSHVSMRWRATACRGLTPVLPNSAGRGYRPKDLNALPSTDRRRVFLPVRSDWVSSLGEVR
jgi:hypothetical protein